jgi:hypothetical protein
MADDADIGGQIPGGVKKWTWHDEDEACAAIEAALEEDPCQPVVLIGHSLGADEAIETAHLLEKKGICVDLLIQIESIGIGDEELPDNVHKGVNLWSTSLDGFVDGATSVEGSENIEVDNTTHTDIDEKESTGAVTTAGSPYARMSAWEIVEYFIEELPEEGCNCQHPDYGPSRYAEQLMDLVLATPDAALGLDALGEETNLTANMLKPAMKSLIRLGLVETVVGPAKQPYFQASRKEKIVWPLFTRLEPLRFQIDFEEAFPWEACTDFEIDGPWSYNGEGYVDERTKSKIKLRWKQSVPKNKDPGPETPRDGKVDITIEIEDKGDGKATVTVTNNDDDGKALAEDKDAFIEQKKKRISVKYVDGNKDKHTIEFEPDGDKEIDIDVDGNDHDLKKKRRRSRRKDD